jgi:hypothetical protein
LTISVIVVSRRMPISISITQKENKKGNNRPASSMHCDNIQTLMDWALIESACFLLASVLPLLSTPSATTSTTNHAFTQRKRGIQFRDKPKSRKTNQCTLAC